MTDHNVRTDVLPAPAPISECQGKLKIFVDLLGRWRKATNLISNESFANVWTRHIADSAQLLDYAPSARHWIDLGSGQDFQELSSPFSYRSFLARPYIASKAINERQRFFGKLLARRVRQPLSTPTEIELIDPNSISPVDAVTARGLAPLPRLVDFANVWLRNGAIGIFPCGRSAQMQVDRLPHVPGLEVESFQSKLDPSARKSSAFAVQRRADHEPNLEGYQLTSD